MKRPAMARIGTAKAAEERRHPAPEDPAMAQRTPVSLERSVVNLPARLYAVSCYLMHISVTRRATGLR